MAIYLYLRSVCILFITQLTLLCIFNLVPTPFLCNQTKNLKFFLNCKKRIQFKVKVQIKKEIKRTNTAADISTRNRHIHFEWTQIAELLYEIYAFGICWNNIVNLLLCTSLFYNFIWVALISAKTQWSFLPARVCHTDLNQPITLLDYNSERRGRK